MDPRATSGKKPRPARPGGWTAGRIVSNTGGRDAPGIHRVPASPQPPLPITIRTPRAQDLAFLRSTHGSSRLARLLDDAPSPDEDASGMDFAERLSLWLDPLGAIRMQAVLQDVRGIAAAAPARRLAGTLDLGEEFAQVRGVLARGIAKDPADYALPGDAPYGGYQRRHLELQRQMEQMAGALRERARDVLARHSARLRQLAALDAAMEQLLAPREQGLLPAAVRMLERRYRDERKAADEGWEQRFAAHWREALLAELDLRLEPVAGLLAALRNERNTTTR